MRLTPRRAGDTVCKICGAGALPFGAIDFNRSCEDRLGAPLLPQAGIPIAYLRCGQCGFVFTPRFNDWSIADFREHIYNDDYLTVDPDYAVMRPERSADFLGKIFPAGREAIRVLDYGGGNGACADLLRRSGFDAVSYEPLVDADSLPKASFDLLFCVEVLEHLPDPVASLPHMLSFLKPTSMLLFSTLLTPDDIEKVGTEWWYLAPRNGHICAFSPRALLTLLTRFGFDCRSNGSWHAAIGKEIPAFARPAFGGPAAREQKV